MKLGKHERIICEILKSDTISNERILEFLGDTNHEENNLNDNFG